MALDTNNLLLSLAQALLTIVNAGGGAALALGRDLWVHQAVESSGSGGAADPYGVLRCYGGQDPSEMLPVPQVALQMDVLSTMASEGMRLANRLYAALYEDRNDGGGSRPRYDWTIPGYQILDGVLVAQTGVDYEIRLLIPAAPPGTIGREGDRGKWHTVFNFEVRYTQD